MLLLQHLTISRAIHEPQGYFHIDIHTAVIRLHINAKAQPEGAEVTV